uniref:Uncharacterized protein n=1 Tax=Arion vulgaris TaxID=1028688 RepID=A0A0B7AFH2_9EUPU
MNCSSYKCVCLCAIIYAGDLYHLTTQVTRVKVISKIAHISDSSTAARQDRLHSLMPM